MCVCVHALDIKSVINFFFFNVRRALLESHKKALLDKLAETDDPPLVFHLVCTILFQEASQTIIVVPGRFVSNIMNFLKPRLINTVYAQLQNYHSKFII